MNDVVRWFSTFQFFFFILFHRRQIPACGHSISPATGNIRSQGITYHHTFLRTYSRKFFHAAIKNALPGLSAPTFSETKQCAKYFNISTFFRRLIC